MRVYAHICVKCDHEAWRHGLIDESVTGRYRCTEDGCGCVVTQADVAGDGVRRLTKTQYESWKWARAVDPALLREMAASTEGREPVRDDFAFLERP